MDEKEQSDFPLWWLDESKRNMEGLRDIASHLQEKSAAMRYASGGYRGPANEMEVQLIETLNRLEAHVSVLSDVVQSTLQIVIADHERKKSRITRAWGWIRSTAHKCVRAIDEHPVYKVVAIASTGAFASGIVWLLIKMFHSAR